MKLARARTTRASQKINNKRAGVEVAAPPFMKTHIPSLE
jgi:hypothetical protein